MKTTAIDRDTLKMQIINSSKKDLEELAIEVFRYQWECNDLYRKYCNLMDKKPDSIDTLADIPFLPISLFKSQSIKSGNWESKLIFQSSGTTGQNRSLHHVREPFFYRAIAQKCFEERYGPISSYCFLCLLPHYLERMHSSLVYMANDFIQRSSYKESGFFLHNYEELIENARNCTDKGIPTILLGVSFALVEIAELFSPDFSELIIMETGGMKGMREEWDKSTLHQYLYDNMNNPEVHAEYGMTELFSQSYAKDQGLFKTASTQHMIIKEPQDPNSVQREGKAGVLNIIDLGNLDTCAFIETEDLATSCSHDCFELKGRASQADIRGCNLLVFDS